jgi:lipoyl synthase
MNPIDLKRPDWIRGKIPCSEGFSDVKGILAGLNLTTVCIEADCPNRGECWDKKHATFLILGEVCTRGCGFCNISRGAPSEVDPGEPERVARAVKGLGIKYAVITSVTRDDLEDKGAGEFAKTANAIKAFRPGTLVEFLIPDFDGNKALIEKAAFSGACVIGHNIEVPENMYPAVRSGADYTRSLGVLRVLADLRDKGADIFVKSSMMIGLGEKEADIIATLEDLKASGVDILYLGQYLSPSKAHHPVKKFYEPVEFGRLEQEARELGFKAVFAGPMVRSSYRAYEAYLSAKNTPLTIAT